MAGYGGQDIALDVNDTPLSVVTPLMQAQQYVSSQNENQYRSALTDSIAQGTSEKSQLFPYTLQATQQKAAMSTAANNRQQLAQAMSLVDPSDPNASQKWDAAMQKLASSGVDDASQYIGKYSPGLQQRLTAAYSADNALSSLSAIGSSGLPAAQLTPEQTQAYDARYAKMSTDQMQGVLSHLDQVRSALQQVQDSPNPSATWAKLSADLGYGNTPFSADNVQKAWQGVAAQETYLQGRIAAQKAGSPNPIVQGQLVRRDDGSEWEVTPGPDGTTAKQVLAPTQKWSNPNASGVSIDQHSGATKTADGGTVGPQGPVFDQIGQFATQNLGATPEEAAMLRRQAWAESRGTPNGPNSSTGRMGLFQFDKDTFNRYGGGDITSVQDQTRAALNMLRANRQIATNAGAQDTEENAYVVAQQGVGGGAALLNAERETPDAKAIDVLTPFYKTRQIAADAITKNGGSLNMTAGQFADHIRNYYDDQAQGGGTSGGSEMPGGYTTDTFTRWALQEATSGQKPTFQRGEIAAKKAYENFFSQKLGEWGVTPAELSDHQATYKALGAAQTKMTGVTAQVDASERTASANADLAVTAMKNMGETQLPPINKIQQAVRGQLFGDPKVVAYNVQLGTFLDEYAKVMSSNSGSGGVTSDSARAEAYSRLSKYTSQNGLEAGIAAMKQDMANRTGSLHGELDELRSARAGLVPNAPGEAAHASGSPAGGGGAPANPLAPSAQWKGYTEGQLWAAQRYRGSNAPAGSQDNPMAVASVKAAQAQIAQRQPTQQNPFFIIDGHGNVQRFPPLPQQQ